MLDGNSKCSPIFANSEMKQTKFFNEKEIENLFNRLQHSKSNPISVLFDTFPNDSPQDNEAKMFPMCLEENESDEKFEDDKMYSNSIDMSR